MKYIKKYEGVNDINWTLLREIEWDNRVDKIQKLLDQGADIEFRDSDNDNKSMLQTAIIRNREDIVRFLIEKGSDLNHQDDSGETALMMAGDVNSFTMLQILIEAGSNWLIEDNHGYDFFDYLLEDVQKMIIEDYPEKYKEYKIWKDAKKYNL
jgi:ankyrin repeat protein